MITLQTTLTGPDGLVRIPLNTTEPLDGELDKAMS